MDPSFLCKLGFMSEHECCDVEATKEYRKKIYKAAGFTETGRTDHRGGLPSVFEVVGKDFCSKEVSVRVNFNSPRRLPPAPAFT